MTKNTPANKVCEIVKEKGIFDSVRYIGKISGRGEYVEIQRDNIRTLIRRERKDSELGYIPNGKITYMYMSNPTDEIHFGTYDPREITLKKESPINKRFDRYEKYPELDVLITDILDFFN